MMTAKAYIWMRIAGLVTLIPLILAAGPLTGYMAGDWLVTRFELPRWLTITLVILGFTASVQETIRVIKIAMKTLGNNE